MKDLLKFILAVCVVFLICFPSARKSYSQSEDYSALIGTWEIYADVGIQMEFIFTMEEDELTGKLVFEMGEGIMENIEFENNELTFIVAIDAGGQFIEVGVSATIEGDEMTGTLSSDMGEADFTGEKKKD
jgi:hypothetical protein